MIALTQGDVSEGRMAFEPERLAELRKARGMSQMELARQAGVSIGWVQKAERGDFQRPSLEYLDRIAKALRVSLGDLTGEPESNQDNNGETLAGLAGTVVRLNSVHSESVTEPEIQRLLELYMALDAEGRRKSLADLEWLRRVTGADAKESREAREAREGRGRYQIGS